MEGGAFALAEHQGRQGRLGKVKGPKHVVCLAVNAVGVDARQCWQAEDLLGEPELRREAVEGTIHIARFRIGRDDDGRDAGPELDEGVVFPDRRCHMIVEAAEVIPG